MLGKRRAPSKKLFFEFKNGKAAEEVTIRRVKPKVPPKVLRMMAVGYPRINGLWQ